MECVCILPLPKEVAFAQVLIPPIYRWVTLMTKSCVQRCDATYTTRVTFLSTFYEFLETSFFDYDRVTWVSLQQ